MGEWLMERPMLLPLTIAYGGPVAIALAVVAVGVGYWWWTRGR